MIRVDKSEIHIKGSRPQIMYDLTRIIHALHKNMGVDKDAVIFAVDLAFKSEEQLKKECDDITKDLSPAEFREMLQGMAKAFE